LHSKRELIENQYRPRKHRLSFAETDNASETHSECRDLKVNTRLANVRECNQCRHQAAKLRERDFEAGLIDVSFAQSTDTIIPVHDCGTLYAQCQHCEAKFFLNERPSHSSIRNPKFGLCCGDSKIKLWTVPEPPDPLATLLTDTSSQCSRLFRCNVRQYSCALSMANMQAIEVHAGYVRV